MGPQCPLHFVVVRLKEGAMYSIWLPGHSRC
jgi:hypothetical protein